MQQPFLFFGANRQRRVQCRVREGEGDRTGALRVRERLGLRSADRGMRDGGAAYGGGAIF